MTKAWKSFFLVLLILLMAGAIGWFSMNLIETNQKIVVLEQELVEVSRDAKAWELSFRNFYHFAKKDWELAQEYAGLVLLHAYSNSLAEELDWTPQQKIQWELTTGKELVERILKGE